MVVPQSILLVSSRQDPAGTHIHDAICHILRDQPELAKQYYHHRSDERLIYWSYNPDIFVKENPDLIVFLSRHASKNPKPVLTVHVTGNYSIAELGGESVSLTRAHPDMMYAVLQNLAMYAPPLYGVSYEVTHHGPTGLSLPSFFVEIGSTEVEWNDTAAVNAVAQAVLNARPVSVIPMIGFGGTHYATRQTELSFVSRAAFGHIVPTRQIGEIDTDMIAQMADMTGAVAAYIDKKALSRDELKKIESILSALGISVLGQTELISIKDLSLEKYYEIIRLAKETVPDSTVHIQSLVSCSHPVPVTIPGELLKEAEKIGSDELNTAISKMPVAILRKGGKKLLPVFILEERDIEQVRNDLIHLCISVILKSSEATLHGDILTIRRTRFDPKKAQMYGIPPGPLYGLLMSGESIIHEGRHILPNMVMMTTITTIKIPVENDA